MYHVMEFWASPLATNGPCRLSGAKLNTLAIPQRLVHIPFSHSHQTMIPIFLKYIEPVMQENANGIRSEAVMYDVVKK